MMTFYVEYHIEDFFTNFFVNAYNLEDAQSIIDDHLFNACKEYQKNHNGQSVEDFYCDARVDHIYVRMF